MFGFGRKRATSETPAEPAVARRRHVGPARMLARMYDAGQADRLTATWSTQPITADEVVRRNLRPLVARSREQAANNDYARAFLRMCRQNIVGPRGVQLQAQAKDPDDRLDKLANRAIEAAFADWGHRDNCDVTGRMSWRALQRAAVLSTARDGEFVLRLVTGAEAGPWEFALQIIDPLRLPVGHDQSGLPDGRFIRHGIEFSRRGRPLAYHFVSTDAGGGADAYIQGGRGFERVPAEHIIHGFLPEMTGQKRGLPWMATALWRMQMLTGFENAALVNARLGASKSGFFEWEEGYGPEAEEDEEIFMEAEPGTFQELPAGVRFKEWNPQYPSGEFSPFQKSMLRGIASGLGVAYNNLANDLEGVNFSSIRQGALDEREHWKDLQEWLIEALIEPVFERWLPHALMAGRITVKGAPLRANRLWKYREVEWQPRRWDWIDPNADVKAAVASKNNLLASPGQIIRDRGRDPNAVWQEIARDIQTMRDAGIDDKFIEIALGVGVANKLEPDGGADQEGKPPEDRRG